jgi:Ca2+-binding RTX toxin-like protein
MRRIGNSSGLEAHSARNPRPRGRAAHFAVAAVAALLATATFTPPASAAVSCSNAGVAVTVTLTADGDKATFLRGPAREILVNGAQCGTATTENTETVTVTGAAAGDQQVFIDLAGGPFVSLQRETTPPSGTSVQFQIDLGGDWDDLFIDGTAAADTFVAGTNGITLDQTSPVGEVDVLLTGTKTLTLRGRGENDSLSGAGDTAAGAPVDGSVWVRFFGGEGNDMLAGGDDSAFAPGPGDDAMVAGSSGASLQLASAPGPVTVDLAAGTATGEGNDTFSGVNGVWGSAFADQLTGDGGDNVLNGNGGNDLIRGAAGDDWILGSFGDDDLDGETGSDTYPDWYVLYETDDDTIADSGAGAGEDDMADFYGASGPVSVDLAAGTASGVGTDTLAGIEKVRGTAHADTLLGASGSETLLGLGGADLLAGRGGADELQGGEGDDLLRGGAGDDSADGGPGENTLAFDEALKGVRVSLAAGTASGEGMDTFAGIQRVRGSAFGDVLLGSGAAEDLFGLSGADTLVGGGGADLLNGGPGRDTAGYAAAPSAVTVDLGRGKASRGAGADSLLGFENVVGSRFADLLRGSAGANVVRGGRGRDTLRGAAGHDRLYGMSGSDALYGAGGNDFLSGSTGAHDRCYQGGGAGRRISCELP